MGTQPVPGGRQGSFNPFRRQGTGRQGTQAAGPSASKGPGALGPASPTGGSKSSSGTLATYNGVGTYLGDAGINALPKAKEQSLMPGYNVFGDGMFFGEGMLKGDMLEAWSDSLEYDNWGTPLPTASAATVAAWKAGKNDLKMKELDNKSTFPYDDQAPIIKK